ncbi:MAG: hypothetical protein HS126_18820 [Anaerolineales bacterium]|nr:hypothetical protein [Anaerolineales bacterium]
MQFQYIKNSPRLQQFISPTAWSLLGQAQHRITSDPVHVKKHYSIYLALWPLVFIMEMDGKD